MKSLSILALLLAAFIVSPVMAKPDKPQAIQQDGAYRVVDARGTTVGWIVDGGSVVMSIGSIPVLVPLDLFGVSGLFEGVLNTTGFWYASASSLEFFFTTPDCTGIPYLSPSAAFFRYGVPYHGQTLYYAGDPIRAIAVESIRVFDTTLTNTSCQPMSFTVPAGPAATFDLRRFSTPFHVE